jgi:cytochrome c-type biogenesis protein CcmH
VTVAGLAGILAVALALAPGALQTAALRTAAPQAGTAQPQELPEQEHGAPEASLPGPAAGPRPQDPVEPALPVLDAEGEARASDLEGRLKCPVCRTQSVRESPSFLAIEMRTRIREMIAEGRSDGEVLDWFAARDGDDILLEPRKRGFGLAAWILPVAALAAGAALLARRARGRTAPPPAVELTPEERDRVERELKLRRA